jgi:hypothetical protein
MSERVRWVGESSSTVPIKACEVLTKRMSIREVGKEDRAMAMADWHCPTSLRFERDQYGSHGMIASEIRASPAKAVSVIKQGSPPTLHPALQSSACPSTHPPSFPPLQPGRL